MDLKINDIWDQSRDQGEKVNYRQNHHFFTHAAQKLKYVHFVSERDVRFGEKVKTSSA